MLPVRYEGFDKMYRRLFVLAAGLIVALGAVRVSASPREDVLSAERALNAAIVRHDSAVVENLIARDYTLTLSDGALYDRSAFLALVRDPNIVYASNDAHDQSVRFYGGSSAIITGILDVRATFGTRDIRLHMRYTDTWEMQHGRWVQVAGHSSNLADKRVAKHTETALRSYDAATNPDRNNRST